MISTLPSITTPYWMANVPSVPAVRPANAVRPMGPVAKANATSAIVATMRIASLPGTRRHRISCPGLTRVQRHIAAGTAAPPTVTIQRPSASATPLRSTKSARLSRGYTSAARTTTRPSVLSGCGSTIRS